MYLKESESAISVAEWLKTAGSELTMVIILLAL